MVPGAEECTHWYPKGLCIRVIGERWLPRGKLVSFDQRETQQQYSLSISYPRGRLIQWYIRQPRMAFLVLHMWFLGASPILQWY